MDTPFRTPARTEWMMDLQGGWLCSDDGENLQVDEYREDRTGLVVEVRCGGRYFDVVTSADEVTVKERHDDA